MRRLARRLSRLGNQFPPSEKSILHFADGTTASTKGGRHSCDLLALFVAGKVVSRDVAHELELVRNAVWIEEQDGLILELLHALQLSPVSTKPAL